jgi:hypothetical protein
MREETKSMMHLISAVILGVVATCIVSYVIQPEQCNYARENNIILIVLVWIVLFRR